MSGFGKGLRFGAASGVFGGDLTTAVLDEAGVFGFGFGADLVAAEFDFGVGFFLSAMTGFGVRF